jgi:hypothetical protein
MIGDGERFDVKVADGERFSALLSDIPAVSSVLVIPTTAAFQWDAFQYDPLVTSALTVDVLVSDQERFAVFAGDAPGG